MAGCSILSALKMVDGYYQLLMQDADISYYSTKVGAVGYLKEVVAANVTGGVANTGNLRQMKEDEIAKARKEHSAMSS